MCNNSNSITHDILCILNILCTYYSAITDVTVDILLTMKLLLSLGEDHAGSISVHVFVEHTENYMKMSLFAHWNKPAQVNKERRRNSLHCFNTIVFSLVFLVMLSSEENLGALFNLSDFFQRFLFTPPPPPVVSLSPSPLGLSHFASASPPSLLAKTLIDTLERSP